jgi:hypothetical protein
MGANATTFVPAYVAGEVLTAADLTVTNSGVPVFADATARDAGFGGTGEKVLAEGQLCYLESTNVVQYYDGSSWATVGPSTPGGLVFIKSQTIGTTVSSVTVTDAFSSTYENYKITVSGGVASASNSLKLQVGAATSGYFGGFAGQNFDAAGGGLSINNQASVLYAGFGNTTTLVMNCDVMGPNLAEFTYISALAVRSSSAFGVTFCEEGSTTQHTAFTILTTTGTMTGGVIRVYGYVNS